jgi:hypothetical protein
MAHTFNANFYITTATVIPIFFLALTLQGSFYKNLMDKIESMAKEIDETAGNPLKIKKGKWRVLGASLAGLVILLAGMGEAFAIAALKDQSDTSFTQNWVFWSAAGLIFITIITLEWPFLRTMTKFNAVVGKYEDRRRSRTPNGRQQRPPGLQAQMESARSSRR